MRLGALTLGTFLAFFSLYGTTLFWYAPRAQQLVSYFLSWDMVRFETRSFGLVAMRGKTWPT